MHTPFSSDPGFACSWVTWPATQSPLKKHPKLPAVMNGAILA
jgi:hypothetical protein